MPWKYKNRPRLYRIFGNMRSRCYNQNFPRFADYGGRGIRVCSEWRFYKPFEIWALGNGYSVEFCLERINNNGSYSPKNCKWVTRKVQARNKRNNRLFIAFGESKIISEWAEDKRCKVTWQNLHSRIYNKWDIEHAIITPTKKIAKARQRLITFKGKTLSIYAWSKKLNMKPAAIYARARRNLTPEEILSPVKVVARYGSRKINHDLKPLE